MGPKPKPVGCILKLPSEEVSPAAPQRARTGEKSLPNSSGAAATAKRKAYLHIVLPLFIASIIAYLDRNNLSYAALTMNKDLGFTAEMFGFGAGIFFAGYVLFEIPGALIAERYSPKWWL